MTQGPRPAYHVSMTTSSISALAALAERCGIDTRRVTSIPAVIHIAYLGAVSAATYPTKANIERKLDEFGAVSAAYGISVDELQDWAETWHDALIDTVHMEATGYTVVDGELVVPVATPAVAA